MIDSATSEGAHAIERLEREAIAWLTTVTPEGQPQTQPIWFVWEAGTILLYGKKIAARNRNLRLNPMVSFHLADVDGADIIEIEGEARLDRDAPVAGDHPAYAAKYAARLVPYDWTWASFAEDYPHRYRIVPTAVRIF